MFLISTSIQPVLNTRKKQLQLWCELILDFVRHHKLYEVDLLELANSPLFWNKKINSVLSLFAILRTRETQPRRN